MRDMFQDGPTESDMLIASSAKTLPGYRGETPNYQPSEYRVRSPGEKYGEKRVVGIGRNGRPWSSPRFNDGRPVEFLAEKELAMLGSLLKFRASRQLRHTDIVLSEHERELIQESAETQPWAGEIDGGWVRDFTDRTRIKAILDSSTSGGSYLNPAYFDDAVVTYPLLFGEITPYVDVQDVPRGSSINTAAVNTPTVTWNQAEGSALTLFDTTSMISQITATVFSCMVGVEIGRDVLADSAVNLGAIVSGLSGERFQSELDNQIANGDGTGEPEGIFTASGTSSITAANGTAGPVSVADVERLVFGVPKQYRMANWNPRFVTSDTMYRRMASVAVGTTDARRVFHPMMDHENYMLMGRPVSIQNNVSNGAVAFACLSKAYRLWRRQGVETRWSDEGATLMRSNTALLVCRARFAGKVIDANAVCKATTLDQTDG